MKKRLLAGLMACALVLSLLPTAAFAADNVTYIDANGVEQTQSGVKEVTNGSTTWNAGWYVVNSAVDISGPVTVTGDVHLILADNCNLTVNGGIGVGIDNSLTIYGQQSGTGKLTASGRYVGIGSDDGDGVGTITINGGTVTATSSTNGVGIGDGDTSTYSGNITINGGTVTATNNKYGIYSQSITISGGTVTATGGSGDIFGGSGFTITISGGIVEVTDNGLDSVSKNNCIVFKKSDGQVYGTANLPVDYTVPEGKNLTIPENTTLTIGSGMTLTNKGTLTINGILDNQGTLAGNGTITGTGTITGNKLIPTYTLPTGLTATYGQTLANVSLPSGWAWNDASTSVGTVGTRQFSAKFTPKNTSFYGEVTKDLAIKVNRATATLTMPATSAVTYGAKLSDITLDSGWAWENGDTVPTVTNSGYTAKYTVSDDTNYDWSGVQGYDSSTHTVTRTIAVTVNKATPSVTPPTAASGLTYNGSAQALISGGGTTGGTLQYSTDGTTWSTDIPTGTNAGNYAVYYKVVGGNNYNDVAAQSVSPVTISQKSISGATVAVSGTPTYTGAAVEPAVTVTLDGNQLTATTDYTVSYKDNTAVGNNSATATVTGTGNYTGTASTNFSIGKATPTVNVAVSLSGSAGARQAVLTVTVTGAAKGAAPTGTVTLTGNNLSETLNLTNGTASYTWSSLTDGQHKVTAAYSGDGNYNAVSNVEKTFDTSKQEQAALTIGSVGDKTYGDPAFTLSASGGSGTGAVTFTSSDPSVIRISGTTATIHKAGGPVTITAAKAEDADYNAATATLSVTVAKKPVVFKANDKTVQQGGTMPTFDYAAVTLAQGDTITTEPTATCTAANTNTVGTFTITFSGAVLSSPDNYEVSYQPGTLTITAKPSTGGGGGGGGYTPPTYKPDITKPSGGGGTPSVSPSNPKQGDTVTVTPKPDDGHEVGGITVTDKNGKPVEVTKKPDGTYTFKQPNGKVTIDVTYRPIDRPWNNPFSDVSESDWFYEAVKFVHRRGLMGGYGDGRFGPNDTLSRAQLAQILFNKEGRPGVNYLLTFSDVAGEAWYTEAIRWATSQGIVGGYGNGMFGPNDPITREQLAVMLWRYSGNPAATDKELHFNDADEISGFALEAMRWAVENGILNGYGDGRLGPKGQATRAQVAQMLKNFIEKQEEENT